MSSKKTTFAEADYPQSSTIAPEYRAISKGALLSLVFGVLGLLSFSLFLYVFRMSCSIAMIAFFCLPGLILGTSAFMRIKTRPDELAGKIPAMVGIFLCAAIFLGGIPMRVIMYVTEVPDGYERISFAELQPESKQSRMPVSKRAIELNGQRVFIEGYIFPGDRSKNLKHFLLVNDLGTCCFGQEPRVTHRIQVELTGDETVDWSYRLRKFGGVITVNPMAVITQEGAVFTLKADHVK